MVNNYLLQSDAGIHTFTATSVESAISIAKQMVVEYDLGPSTLFAEVHSLPGA